MSSSSSSSFCIHVLLQFLLFVASSCYCSVSTIARLLLPSNCMKLCTKMVSLPQFMQHRSWDKKNIIFILFEKLLQLVFDICSGMMCFQICEICWLYAVHDGKKLALPFLSIHLSVKSTKITDDFTWKRRWRWPNESMLYTPALAGNEKWESKGTRF